MSLNVVKRPFKTGGKVYSAGDVIVNPADITLYRTKVREGKIVLIDEHNLEQYATYLTYKHGVEGALETLTEALAATKPVVEVPVDTEYLEKVRKHANKHGVEMEGRPVEDVVAEIKAKASIKG